VARENSVTRIFHSWFGTPKIKQVNEDAIVIDAETHEITTAVTWMVKQFVAEEIKDPD
jgi:hypothetical protein